MSRSKYAVELYALLVDETYGELSSRIYTILLRKGRQPILNLSTHTRLTSRQIRHGLAVLVQQNLVYHHVDSDTKVTYYEANYNAAYGLVRSGKILEIVESRYGTQAKDIVQNLLLLGHTKVSDLEKAYDLESKQKQHGNTNSNGNGSSNGNSNGTSHSNGINGQNTYRSAGQLHTILTELLQAGLVEPVVQSMLRSPTDTYAQVEREILRDHYQGSTKGIKQKEELRLRIQSRLQALRTEGREWKFKEKGKKRPLNGEHVNGMNGASKKRLLSNGSGAVNGGHSYEDDGLRLDPNLALRINYEKCTVAIRNQRLVALANNRFGHTTSQIYAEALKLMEDKIPRCRLDPKIDSTEDLTDGPTVTTMELATALGRSIDPGLGIGKVSSDKIDTRQLEKASKTPKQNDEVGVEGDASTDEEEADEVMEGTNGHGNTPGVDQDTGSHDDDPFEDDAALRSSKKTKVTFQDDPQKLEPSQERENRMLQVRNHLLLLSADKDCCFLRRCGGRGLGEWCVDFEPLIQYLQETELDSMLLENFGKSGHRLARMLRKLGKLDEKQLPNLALIKQKDIRTKLAEMQMAGVVDIQEVPRDNSRTANRTIFLWYFDTERVSAILLDNMYKMMTRCLQRLDIEKRRKHDVLSLTERSDVRDEDPTTYLDASQLSELQDIVSKEENLLGHIARLDDLVGLFRDF